jgi:hypothetical protein
MWAYSLDDLQPALSFGLIHAYKEVVITKSIKVINISGQRQTLRIRNEVAYKSIFETGQEKPLTLTFFPQDVILPEGCNSEVVINVTVAVDPAKAPPNYMTSTGADSADPTRMDRNEFGGWVVIENIVSGKDISLPYMSLVRQASHLILRNNVIEDFNGNKTEVTIGLANSGAGKLRHTCYIAE